MGVAEDIGTRVKQYRTIKGYKLADIAKYVHGHWGVTEGRARKVVSQIERPYMYESLRGAHMRNQDGISELVIKQGRIADYFASMAVDSVEVRRLLSGIETIQPRFELGRSRVKPIHPELL
ncbi:MAG: hypothetical protein ACE5FT_03105 [Candidatus Nanoarchaeia archaeon]